KNGELVQVEPGSGRLLGLLNFNAFLRRVTLDFSDVVADGLRFDQMQYAGRLEKGTAILEDAFLFSPAAFVRMEGEIDLEQEILDIQMHVAPELGGNLALLSALANQTAGAVVFLLQNIFKDEMRNNSLISYRAAGTWDDFEMKEIENKNLDIDIPTTPLPEPKPEGELPLPMAEPKLDDLPTRLTSQ
ncbi:MAG: AsmA-like C-terminal region-containing protein, partial [Pseudomonadota bacterium]